MSKKINPFTPEFAAQVYAARRSHAEVFQTA